MDAFNDINVLIIIRSFGLSLLTYGRLCYCVRYVYGDRAGISDNYIRLSLLIYMISYVKIICIYPFYHGVPWNAKMWIKEWKTPRGTIFFHRRWVVGWGGGGCWWGGGVGMGWWWWGTHALRLFSIYDWSRSLPLNKLRLFTLGETLLNHRGNGPKLLNNICQFHWCLCCRSNVGVRKARLCVVELLSGSNCWQIWKYTLKWYMCCTTCWQAQQNANRWTSSIWWPRNKVYLA